MFGHSPLMDHPFIAFKKWGGGTIHLPCGTIPTALEEKTHMQEDGSSKYETRIIVAVPSQAISWAVAHSAAEVQEMLRVGLMKLNQEAPGPKPLPFRPS